MKKLLLTGVALSALFAMKAAPVAAELVVEETWLIKRSFP